MKKRFFLFLAVFFLFLPLMHLYISFSSRPEPSIPLKITADATETTLQIPLFPGFITENVTSVSISTPQSIFNLRHEQNLGVSINGQLGDPDIFSTLLDQIEAMTIEPIASFSVQCAPLLTLIVQHKDTEYSAAFYNDGDSGEFAHIITHRENMPIYARTEGWRIGTLLLTCEGVRVQDALGRETPIVPRISQ